MNCQYPCVNCLIPMHPDKTNLPTSSWSSNSCLCSLSRSSCCTVRTLTLSLRFFTWFCKDWISEPPSSTLLEADTIVIPLKSFEERNEPITLNDLPQITQGLLCRLLPVKVKLLLKLLVPLLAGMVFLGSTWTWRLSSYTPQGCWKISIGKFLIIMSKISCKWCNSREMILHESRETKRNQKHILYDGHATIHF